MLVRVSSRFPYRANGLDSSGYYQENAKSRAKGLRGYVDQADKIVLSKSKRNTARHVAHNLRSPIFMPVSVI